MKRAIVALGCVMALAACGAKLAPGSVSVAAGLPVSAVPAHVPDGDWPAFDYDAVRNGVGPAQTGISAGDLGALRARVVQLDGTVDASAIQLHGVRVGRRVRDVIFVTTSYGKTIAIDPGNGHRLWEFTPRGIGAWAGSSQVTTATPVADPDRRYIYAASPDGFIHKLSVTTGRQIWATRITYDATREKIASALNYSNGMVIATTGGYIGDAPFYQGHVAVLSASTGRRLHVWNSLCSNRHYLLNPASSCPGQSDSAIWGRSGAVVEPGSGRLLVATGNGPFNGRTDWGDSALELTPDAGRLLQNWTPTNEAQLDAGDTDVGSTSPVYLPGGYVVQGGKAGILTLLSLRRMNGHGNAGPTGGELQDIQTPGSGAILTAPAVWQHAGRTYLFVGDDAGTAGYVLGRDHRLHTVWDDQTTGGTSPVLAGGLLFVYNAGSGQVIVRRPVSGAQLAAIGVAGGHWNSPIVVGGRIILPVGNYQDHNTTGQLYILHLPGR